MTIVASETLRLGVLVERTDSEWRPFEYRMFYCRQRDPGDNKRLSAAEWAKDEVSGMSYHGFDKVFKRMKVGERRRYWMHIRITCYRDYWGEYDSGMRLLNIKRA